MTTDFTIYDEVSRKRFVEHIRSLNLAKPWVASIKRKAAKRSLSQNALYWRFVDIAADHFGYTKDIMDIELKRHCDGPVETYTDLDGVERARFSTSKADTPEMAAYMDRVSLFLASEHGLILPHPADALRTW